MDEPSSCVIVVRTGGGLNPGTVWQSWSTTFSSLLARDSKSLMRVSTLTTCVIFMPTIGMPAMGFGTMVFGMGPKLKGWGGVLGGLSRNGLSGALKS